MWHFFRNLIDYNRDLSWYGIGNTPILLSKKRQNQHKTVNKKGRKLLGKGLYILGFQCKMEFVS